MFRKYKKDIKLNIIAFLFFFLLTVFITFPLIFHLGDFVTGWGDELVIAWIQNWVIHSLSTNPFSLFEANLFFPYHNTLAYSDLFLTSSIFSIIPLKLVGEPIAVVNFTFISSLVLLGFSIYLLSFYLTKDFFLSLFSGILVIFSPAVLDKKVHLQILAIEWVPLAILFFLIFIKKHKLKYLAISLLFFLMQAYNSFLPGYFIIFSYLIIFIYSLFNRRKQTLKLFTKKSIFLFVFSIALILPIAIPYYQISKEFNYTRDIRDAIHFAIQPEDLFYPSEHTRLQGFLLTLPFNQKSQNNEFKPGYLGFIFTILMFYSLWYFIKNFKKNGNILNSFAIIGLLGFVLSLGPALHLGRQTIHDPFPIPLPYALFYYILPGFQGFRNSARWEMLFILAMAIVIALVLNKISKKYSKKTKIGVYLILIIGCIIEFNSPIKFLDVPQKKEFPVVYNWLNAIPKDESIIIMPAYNWNMAYQSEEIIRDYYSIANFRRTVNGYSGFFPPPWQELAVDLHNNFPKSESVSMIKDLGVDYIIIDKKTYDKGFKEKNEKINGESVINVLKKNPSLEFIKPLGDYYIFKF